MKYLAYRVPDSLIVMFGNDKESIISTLDYYRDIRGKRVATPSDKDFLEVEKVKVECAFPLCCMDHYLEAKINDCFKFRINANAFDHVMGIVNSFDELKRGSLYKFDQGLMNGDPKIGPIGLYYLPEDVMKGLRDYDWAQHMAQVREWTYSRQVAVDDMERVGILEKNPARRAVCKKKPDYDKN